LRKGGELINQNKDFANYKLSEEEKKLIKTIYQYPNIVREAGLNYSPALIANYGYEMAKAFNHFYHDHVIVDENDLTTTGFRLAISKLTSIVILESMNLLGIRVPERM
jgi:arginyl-tRNA synthetase